MSDEHVFEISGAAIGAAAALSNIIEIIILARKGKERNKADEIILSLSFADMLVGIAYLGTWSIAFATGFQNENITKLISSILLIFCFNTSVFHILTIASERFYAVRYPIKYRVVMTKEKTRKMIMCIWVLSISIVTSFAIPDVLKSSKLLGVYKGVSIIASGIVVVICYGHLSCVIWKRGKFICPVAVVDIKTNDRRSQKQRRDTIFSYAIATAYIICSFPFAVVMIFRIKVVNFPELMLIVNSLIDPILYFWKGYYDKSQRENGCIAVIKQNQTTVCNCQHNSATK